MQSESTASEHFFSSRARRKQTLKRKLIIMTLFGVRSERELRFVHVKFVTNSTCLFSHI